jgi:hypothetical protein
MKFPIFWLIALSCISLVSAESKKATKTPVQQKSDYPRDWCQLISNNSGQLYKNKNNPWIDSIAIGGRFHYQMGSVHGEDVRGNSFKNHFEENRRFRIETEIDFLTYFDIELGVNLVDDRRFRNSTNRQLQWGYDTFDSAILSFNLGKAIGTEALDDIKLHYGRMKFNITEEVHESSNRILTIERSNLADELGGNNPRPTGLTMEMGKNDWTGTVGIFSGEDDSAFIGSWNGGEVAYGSLAWQISKRLLTRVDHVQNNPSGSDDFLGYAQATSLSAVYEKKDWGLMVNLIHGDNGGADNGNLTAMRQGDFYGSIVMPWYWIIKKRLQCVARYQYARADEMEGLRINNRYIGALHNTPSLDLDGGYGDENHSFYLGMNWHICGDHFKVMGGVSYDKMSARTSDFTGTTYLLAVRTFF